MDLTDYPRLLRAEEFFLYGYPDLRNRESDLARLLFLFDFQHLSEVGRPVTWAEYRFDRGKFSVRKNGIGAVQSGEASKGQSLADFTFRQLRILGEIDDGFRQRGQLGLTVRYRHLLNRLPEGVPIPYELAFPIGGEYRSEFFLMLEEARDRRTAVVCLAREAQRPTAQS